MGLSFKENCPDLRNTRVIDIIQELCEYGVQVDVHDPWVDPQEAEQEYGIALVDAPEAGCYDAVMVAVAHEQFRAMGEQGIRQLGRPGEGRRDLKYRQG